jgi:hypothetical protein
MNNIMNKSFVIAVLAASLLIIAASAQASIFSGWKPFKKPLEPAKKASEEVSKAISGTRPSLPPAAQQQVDKIADKAKEAEKENKKAQETIGGQRDSFLLTAAGLCVTNLITLGGFLRSRRTSRLADEKAQLEIELLKAKLAEAKAGKPGSSDESL